MSQQRDIEYRKNLNSEIIKNEELNEELAISTNNTKTNQFCGEIRPPAVGQEFKERFTEKNAVQSASTSLMVDGKKPFPSKVASWISKRLSPMPTMQPTNLSGVRGGAPPALPPKPKPRNPGLVFSNSKVAPMSNPVPPPTVSISKPPVSFPPKSEQVLAQSSKLLNSPAHSSASRTNSNNSSLASGSVLSTKTSSDNCAQSHKSSSSERVQHHTTRAGTSDSSKSPETISEPTEVNTTLDSTLKEEQLQTLQTETEKPMEQQEPDPSCCITDVINFREKSLNSPSFLGSKEIKDSKSDIYLVSKSGQGSIKSMDSLDDKKIDSPLRASGSERGRVFEPEGSVDLSPSNYSETSAHTTQSSSIQSSPPTYNIWRESLDHLLEDLDGTNLFYEFLKESNCTFLLDFFAMIKGFKKQLSQRDGTEIVVNPNECDRQILYAREETFEFYRKTLPALNKRFINTNSKYRSNQLPEKLHGRLLLDSQTKETIQNKIDMVKRVASTHDSEQCIPPSSASCRYHVHIDGNIFDGVQNAVFDCMQTPYANFFRDQLFLDHVNEVDAQRNIQVESEDNMFPSHPMVVSDDHSSGSSISAKGMTSGNTTLTVDTTQIDSAPLTSITSTTSDKTKDSGFSGTSAVGGSISDKSGSVDKQGQPLLSRSHYPATTSENVRQKSAVPTRGASDLLSISQIANTSSSQLSTSVIHQTTLSGEPLPAIEEDRELKLCKHNAPSAFLQNTECSDSSSNSKFKNKNTVGQQIDPRLINPSDGLSQHNTSVNTSRPLNTHGKRGNSSNWQEIYPSGNLTDRNNRSQVIHGENYRSLSKPNITSASYAYHTSNEAFSSSYYPVSKQNSEVHSQSSGALGGGGDTTDDNYSTLTDPSPYQMNDPRYGRPSKSSSDLSRMQPNLMQHNISTGKRHQISAIGRSSEPTNSQLRTETRHNEIHKEKRQMRKESKRDEEVKNEHIKRGNREHLQGTFAKPPQKADESSSEATNSPSTFAAKLIERMNNFLREEEERRKEEESKKKLDRKLDILHDKESSVASVPPASSAAQRIMMNRSRSAANDPNEESDQSILDDHVARNFPNTPPVPRSPPGATSMRSRSSKTSGATRSSKSTGSGATTKTLHHQSFDSRMGHPAFSHQTLPSRANITGSHQPSFTTNRGQVHQTGHPAFGGHSQSGSVPSYSSNAPGVERDLVYYQIDSRDSRVQHGSRSRHPGSSAPFSDVSYPISANNPGSVFSARQPQQSQPIIPFANEERTRHIANWVESSAQLAVQQNAPSGRRSKSQTREGRSESSFPVDSSHPARYSAGRQAFQPQQHHAGSQIGAIQPHDLANRLHQAQKMGNQGFGNTSLMAPSQLSGAAQMNISLPVASRDDSVQGFSQAHGGQRFIVAVYHYEKDDVPYRIKLPLDFGQEHTVTLHKVKEHMPKKGTSYRFYFKANIDGDICFEEETDNNALVPTFDGKINVQCRDG